MPRRHAGRRSSHQYVSRNRYDNKAHEFLRIDDVYAKYVGIFSPYAVIWGCLFILAPLSYIYIAMVLMRELFGHHLIKVSSLPWLREWTIASAMSRLEIEMDRALEGTLLEVTPQRQWLWFWIEVWCYLEAVFYILLKMRIRYLQTQDPLEASFSAAPLMEIPERAELWRNMMESEQGRIIDLLSGWFFDGNVTEEVSAYDIHDFVVWSMFEGRHQEHLTVSEIEQVDEFVDEMEHRISLELYGEAGEDDSCNSPLRPLDESLDTVHLGPDWKRVLPKPRKGKLHRNLQPVIAIKSTHRCYVRSILQYSDFTEKSIRTQAISFPISLSHIVVGMTRSTFTRCKNFAIWYKKQLAITFILS